MPASPCGEDFVFKGRLLKESNSSQYCRDKGGVVLAESTQRCFPWESSDASDPMLVPLNLWESRGCILQVTRLQGKDSGVTQNPRPALGSPQTSVFSPENWG